MPDLFLEGYDGQTTEQLLALEGKYRIDSLVLAFEQGIQLKTNPSIQEQYVLAIEGLEREVNNGGYLQFFFNSSGEFARIIEAALRATGCPKTADMTRDAVAAMAVVTKGDLSAEILATAATDPDDNTRSALSACDDRYFSNDEPIADRLFEWIRANKDSIRVGTG